MALSYVAVDRDQQFLLPPNMCEWLPEGHLAWFVIDVVAELDTAALHELHPNDGAGRAAYDPDMLLALVLYAYCCGEYSSRAMARHCDTDVAFRVITADHRPHHGTISRFIAAHDTTVEDLFVQVLALCRAAGMVQLGMVAIDGTKVGAAASFGANRSRRWLEDQARRAVRAHRSTDEAEDAAHGEQRGDELPEELADPATRQSRIRRALERLRSEEQAAAEAAASDAARRAKTTAATGRRPRGRRPDTDDGVAEAAAAVAAAEAANEAKLARYRQRERDGQRRGRPPVEEPVSLRRARAALARVQAAVAVKRSERAETALRARANITDPDSRIMRDGHGGRLQGYNAQAAVSQDQVVVAAAVVNAENDWHQLIPMVRASRTNLAVAGMTADPDLVLADAGYCTEANLTEPDMPDMLVATGRRDDNGTARDGSPSGEATAAMTECLTNPRAAAVYAKRAGIVEPVFADAKDRRQLRRFRRRGLDAVNAEWNLICLTHNLMKLFRRQTAAPAFA
jgi:transposase